MSIYGTMLVLNDDHEHECQKWVEDVDERDSYHLDDSEPCTCGRPRWPLKYQGSHVLPSDDPSEKGGYVEVGMIPDHITRDGRDDAPEGALKDWLRLGVNESTCVLTRRQVTELRDTLTAWLDREPAERES